MILTINFIDASDKNSPVLLAVCNLNIDAKDPDAIRRSYQKYIPKFHTIDFKGNAADLLITVTKIVQKDNPDMVLLSVNDDLSLSDQSNALNVEFVKRSETPGPLPVEDQTGKYTS